jgi:acetyltransferase
MRQFFYPSSIAIFGVASHPRNLAKNIVLNCQEMGFKGDIFPIGRTPGKIYGKEIITDPESLPKGIDLAVILIPADAIAETLEICGRKGIHHAIISSGGFREFNDENNQAERDVLFIAKQYGIRIIGPNCIGVICTESGLCTPFNPVHTEAYRKGPISLIIQSGGVTTRTAYYLSEEYLGFSKIISVGNKLNVNEVDLIKYLMDDEATEQIYLYLESIEDGKELMGLSKESKKPVVIFKSNVSHTASVIARSHTAALSNNDRLVDGALKQAGIVRVNGIHEMTVCAKALRLPPLKGDRLVAISLSGGFAVIIGDACEKYGFYCPDLPRQLLEKIESYRRGGVIRMANPMDFGDIHDTKALFFAIESCLALNDIDGLVLSIIFDPKMIKLMGGEISDPRLMLDFFNKICERTRKPIALSFFSKRHHIDELKKINTFPVFNDPVESVLALHMLRQFWRGRENKQGVYC